MHENIRTWWSDVVLCTPIYRIIKKGLYSIFKILLFFFELICVGALAHIIENVFNLTSKSREFELSNFLLFLDEKKYIITVFIVLAVILYVSKKSIRERNILKDRINLLNLTLRWFFEDLGFDEFENEKKIDYELRCTIWSPIRYSNDPKNMVIEQVADYCPSVSNSPFIHGNRVYKTNGRRRKVARVDKNGELLPVGLVGKTVLFALNNYRPTPQVGYIEKDADFVKEMEDQWNFLPYEAKKLTNDRRSYYCYPIMPRTCDDILALLYIDSKKLNAFTNEAGKDVLLNEDVINRYIIRISKLFQKDQNLNLGSSEGE